MSVITNDPLVSVVLPTYNRGGTLLRAVKTVLNQDYENIELIVVDDASTDNSLEILHGIGDPRLRVIRHVRNSGVSAATNTGVQEARGQLVAFQDSDDEWLTNKLSKQVAIHLKSGADCVGVYCIKIVYGRDPKFRRGKRLVACVPGPDDSVVEGDLRQLLWRRNIISPQTAICTRESIERLGGFDAKLRTDQDWDFFSRLAEVGTIAFLDEPLVNTYLQPDSISTDAVKGRYSQFIITNKMKRRGVPMSILSEHWSRLGYNIGKRKGSARRGAVVLCAAIAGRPLHLKTWLRYFAVLLKR